MFSWLKKLTAKKKEDESIPLADLGVFLRDEQVKREQLLADKLSQLKQQSAEQISSISESISQLANASLLNERIPERARAAMEGNRSEFIRRALFTTKLEIPDHPNSWPEFFATFQEHMHDFATGSLRPLAVLREFLEHESNAVAEKIALLQKGIFAHHNEYSISMVHHFPALRQELQDIESQTASYQSAIDRINSLKKEKSQLDVEKTAAEQSATAIEQSPRFGSVNELKKGLEQVLNQRRSLKQSFLDKFGVLDTALRKYAKMTLQESGLIEQYLSDPVEALIADRQLRLLRILENVKTAVNANSFDLKDQKKGKTIATIAEMNPALLNLFLRTNNTLKQQEETLLKSIQDNEAMQELLVFRKKAKDCNEKASVLSEELESTSRLLASLDVSARISRLVEQVQVISGKKVEI